VSSSDQNRRRFTRIHFDAATDIHHKGSDIPVKLVDISFKGALIEADQQLPLTPGDEVEATIHLLGNDVMIKAPMTLKHQEGIRYGFALSQLDLDSLTLLRRIVELNLGDETLLERELEHLLHD